MWRLRSLCLEAAAVFGLSPVQKRLAGLIAEGLSLPDIADKMKIKASTARTHLERIYDKVGVSSRRAIVAAQHHGRVAPMRVEIRERHRQAPY
jgi:DNA-binding CsgD family transcriptional regulator